MHSRSSTVQNPGVVARRRDPHATALGSSDRFLSAARLVITCEGVRPTHAHRDWRVMTASQISSLQPNTAQDNAAVRAVLDAIYAAWADNDADAFVAPYAPDATAIHSGTLMADRDAIRTVMATGFQGPLKGSLGLHEVQSIRFVGPDTAIVFSKGAIEFAGQSQPAAESRTLDGWVLSRWDGAWRVEAFHNCPEIVG